MERSSTSKEKLKNSISLFLQRDKYSQIIKGESQMMYGERARINLTILNSKQHLKKIWKDLSPNERRSLREEFGDWMS